MLLLAMVFMHLPYANELMLVLSVPVLVLFGRSFYVNAWKQAKLGRSNMDTLVALSTAIAFLFSLFNTFFPEFWYNRGLEPHVYYEAATVIIAFVLTGKLMEERAKVTRLPPYANSWVYNPKQPGCCATEKKRK